MFLPLAFYWPTQSERIGKCSCTLEGVSRARGASGREGQPISQWFCRFSLPSGCYCEHPHCSYSARNIILVIYNVLDSSSLLACCERKHARIEAMANTTPSSRHGVGKVQEQNLLSTCCPRIYFPPPKTQARIVPSLPLVRLQVFVICLNLVFLETEGAFLNTMIRLSLEMSLG